MKWNNRPLYRVVPATTLLLCAGSAEPSRAEPVLPSGYVAEVFVEMYKPFRLATDGQYLYVAQGFADFGDQTVSRIDLNTGEVTASAPVPDPDGIDLGPSGEVFVAGGQYVWKVQFPPAGPAEAVQYCLANFDFLHVAASGNMLTVDQGSGVKDPESCDLIVPGGSCPLVDPSNGALYYCRNGIMYRGNPETAFASVGDAWDLQLAPGGRFGNGFYVAGGGEGTVKHVLPGGGDAVEFLGSTNPNETTTGLAFADQSTLYVAQPDIGRILRIIANGPIATQSQTWGGLKRSLR